MPTPRWYNPRPPAVEGMSWDGTAAGAASIRGWTGAPVQCRPDETCVEHLVVQDPFDGTQFVLAEGDYVLRDEHRRLHACSAYRFRDLYMPADRHPYLRLRDVVRALERDQTRLHSRLCGIGADVRETPLRIYLICEKQGEWDTADQEALIARATQYVADAGLDAVCKIVGHVEADAWPWAHEWREAVQAVEEGRHD